MKYFIFLLLSVSPYLIADTYRFELTEQATDLDGSNKIKGQFKCVITSDIEIFRTETPATPEDKKTPDGTIDWAIQFKSFSFDHEKTGVIHSFTSDTLQELKLIGQKIKDRKEMLYLSDSGLITHNIAGLKLQGKDWHDYEVNLKKSIEEGKLEWTDVYTVARLIRPMPICFMVDDSVAVGDIIDLAFLKSLPEEHLFSTDVLTGSMIVTERNGSQIMLESHNTRFASMMNRQDVSRLKDDSFIQEYLQMEYDLNKQMPKKITYNRFTKIVASKEYAQTVTRNFVIVDEK